jgi:hypothetical protein
LKTASECLSTVTKLSYAYAESVTYQSPSMRVLLMATSMS